MSDWFLVSLCREIYLLLYFRITWWIWIGYCLVSFFYFLFFFVSPCIVLVLGCLIWFISLFFPFSDAACPTIAKVPNVMVIHGEGDGTLEHMKV